MAKTLCEWTEKDIEKKREKLAALLSHPQFYCKRCARAASQARVLCKPRKLSEAASGPLLLSAKDSETPDTNP